MNIYLLEQNTNPHYDTFDAVVVIAENKKEARLIHPNDENYLREKIEGWNAGRNPLDGSYLFHSDFWVNPEDIDKIKVTCIGVANEDQEKGIVLASFNAS